MPLDYYVVMKINFRMYNSMKKNPFSFQGPGAPDFHAIIILARYCQNILAENHVVSILVFVSHIVFVTVTHLCLCRAKAISNE